MRKSLLFGLFSFLILALFSFAKPQLAKAACPADDPVCKQLEMFNQRRSGDQMNLETWYSGKSGADSSDPSSIGFSQIVLLDLYSRINGKSINWSDPADVIKKLVGNKDIFSNLTQAPPKNDGVINQLGSIMGAAIKSPPVSLTNYLADVRQNISKHGIIQPAYAQGAGFGFQNLLPILPIWKAFRNVAYFAFILVFVLYGFMIMFRMKINAQNVATFQTAIPKVVITLIIITFAYAIAGFMIDLMFVVFNLILSIFQTSGLITDVNNKFVQAGSGQFGILPSLILSLFASFAYVPSRLISVLSNLPTWVGFITDLILTATGLGIILRIIIIIAIIYSYVKLIFKLFEAYITVILQVIFSPIILLQDVLPGSQAFGNWLRNITAHLSVFPVTMIMFLLSYIFMIQPLANTPLIGGTFGVQNLQSSSTGLKLPLIGMGGVFGGTDSSAILVVVGFFIILMASKYVDMVRDALKVPPFKYGGALGEALLFGYGRADTMATKGLPGLPDRTQAVIRSRWAGVREPVGAVIKEGLPKEPSFKPTETKT